MGGFGQALLLMIGSISALPTNEGEIAFENLLEEVANFWKNQDKMQNQHLTKH